MTTIKGPTDVHNQNTRTTGGVKSHAAFISPINQWLRVSRFLPLKCPFLDFRDGKGLNYKTINPTEWYQHTVNTFSQIMKLIRKLTIEDGLQCTVEAGSNSAAFYFHFLIFSTSDWYVVGQLIHYIRSRFFRAQWKYCGDRLPLNQYLTLQNNAKTKFTCYSRVLGKIVEKYPRSPLLLRNSGNYNVSAWWIITDQTELKRKPVV